MEWGSDSCGGTVNTGRERERERKKIIILSATGWRRTEGEGDTGTATSITLSHSWEKHNSQVKTSTLENKDDRCGTMFVFVMMKVWKIINLDKDGLVRAAVQPVVHRFLIC